MEVKLDQIHAAMTIAKMDDIRAIMGSVSERLAAPGHITLCATTTELFRAAERIARETLARDYSTPQILRHGFLSGKTMYDGSPDLMEEYGRLLESFFAFLIAPGSPADSPGRRWSVRTMQAYASLESFDKSNDIIRSASLGTKTNLESFDKTNDIIRSASLGTKTNLELKFFVRPVVEGMLSPLIITDRDVVLYYDDDTAAYRWGIVIHGSQYTALFASWFDTRWNALSDTSLAISRRGFHEDNLRRMRAELEVLNSSRAAC
jgi:hypothetical protein